MAALAVWCQACALDSPLPKCPPCAVAGWAHLFEPREHSRTRPDRLSRDHEPAIGHGQTVPLAAAK